MPPTCSFTWLTQRLAQFLDAGHDGIAHVAHVLYGTFRRGFVGVSTGVLDDDGDQAKVSAVAYRRIYSDLGGYSADHERDQATVAQRHGERRAFESRHRDLVEDCLVIPDPEFGRQLEAGAAAQEPRFDGFGTVDLLPGHRLAQLKQPCQLGRQ